MANTSTKNSIAAQAKTKAQLLAELNEAHRRIAQLETAAAESQQMEQALRASEARFKAVFDCAGVGLALIDPNDLKLQGNPALQQMLGHSAAELSQPANLNMTHPDDRVLTKAWMADLLTGRLDSIRIEKRYLHKNGSTVWVDLSITPIRDEQGQPVAFIGAMVDITVRKLAEAAFRASEARFTKIFQASPLSISIVRLKDHQFIEVNKAWEIKSGFSRAETIGRTPLELNLWVNPDERQQFLTQLSEQGTVQGLEAQFRLKSGLVAEVLIAAELADIAGERCMLVITQNISERKRMEETLRESEAKFATVFRASPLPISITRFKDQQIIDVNPAWETHFGFGREEAIGRTTLELNLQTDPGYRERLLRQMREQGKVRDMEVQTLSKSGVVADMLVATELIDIGGEPCLLILGQDITARKQMEEALQVSEQKFRQIIEYSGDGIFLAAETGQIVEWNPMMEQITGLARAEALGRLGWQVRFGLLPTEQQTPSMYEQIKANAQAYFQTGQDPQLNRLSQLEIQRQDGSYRDLQERPFSIQSRTGFWRSSIIRDVTEQKQAERIEAAQLAVNRILAESPEPEAALKQILEAIATGLEWELAKLWWPDSSGSRLIWRDGWRASDQPELVEFDRLARSLTFAPDEGLPGAVWQTGRAVWDQGLRLTKLAAAARALGLHAAVGIPIIRDGVTVGVMTFFNHSTRPLEERLLTTLTDLGRQIGQFLARKETEATLRRYEQIVSTTPDWMSLVDRNYVYRIVNQTYLTLNNKTSDQIIGHRVAELTGETVFETVIKPQFDRVLAGELVQYQEWFDFATTGRRFNNITYAPYREKDGAISGVLVSGRDMTEAKLLEDHLQQVQKMGAIGQLAAGMAHHYNSMLTAIIGYTSLSLRALPPNSPATKNLERVLDTAERMAVLVRQLLAFAQKQLLQPKTAPLNDLVSQLKGELQQLTPAPVEFALELAPEMGQVKVDPRQFEYLLRALVSNAVDAMPEGGRLTLTTAKTSLAAAQAAEYDLPPGDYALLTVQDTGFGLSDEVKAHLFEPFFTTKEIGQGTGLGLAMSLGIAKQHGGHLLAQSQSGQGAVFMLYLPLAAPPPPPLNPAAAPNSVTILLVEPAPSVRKLMVDILNTAGYTILTAADSETAWQLVAGQAERLPHLVLAPADLPGQGLVQRLRASDPGLKVIFVIDREDEAPAETEATAFLTKPFRPSSLLQKVQAMLA